MEKTKTNAAAGITAAAPQRIERFTACTYGVHGRDGSISFIELERVSGYAILTTREIAPRQLDAEGRPFQSAEAHKYVVSDGQAAFDALAAVILKHGMMNWGKQEALRSPRPEDAIRQDEAGLSSLRMQVNGRTTTVLGTPALPSPGVNALLEIREILKSFADPAKETPPKTVQVNGRRVKTVSGTGNSVGAGAVLNYEGKLWWAEEGYVGRYEMTPANLAAVQRSGDAGEPHQKVFLEIRADGTLHLKMDDRYALDGKLREEALWQIMRTGTVGSRRVDLGDLPVEAMEEDELRAAGVQLEALEDEVGCDDLSDQAGGRLAAGILLRAAPEPHPGTFEGWNFRLTRENLGEALCSSQKHKKTKHRRR